MLALLLEPERELPSTSEELRLQAKGSALESDLDDVIAAILISRFPSRSILEICAMGGITVEDFSQSLIYQEIAGINRRCGPLSAATSARIQTLPLEQLEALAEALLDFQGAADLITWLANHG